MIYEHFNMRLHASEHQTQEPSSWVIRTGEGELNAFTVGSIVNPKPVVKKNSLDILGTSGEVDLTEESGRVFFENKTVTVILQGRADFEGMEDVESFFSPFQGRLMDFTTDNYLSVTGFQVGRMAAEFDRKKNRITIVFDTDPYRYSEIVFYKALPVLSNYEVMNNDSAWSITGGYGGETLVEDDHVTWFAFCFDTVGAELSRRKIVGASSGFFALGVVELIGGDIWFNNQNGKTSKTIAEITPLETPVEGGSGKIEMTVRCDGSYYEWVTVNGERRYLPTVRCQYILSNYLPVDGNDLANTVIDSFLSNVNMRPYVLVGYSDAYIISDGVASLVGVRRDYERKPRVVLPNVRADFSGSEVQSVMCAVKVNSSDSPTASMRYRQAEVF